MSDRDERDIFDEWLHHNEAGPGAAQQSSNRGFRPAVTAMLDDGEDDL